MVVDDFGEYTRTCGLAVGREAESTGEAEAGGVRGFLGGAAAAPAPFAEYPESAQSIRSEPGLGVQEQLQVEVSGQIPQPREVGGGPSRRGT